MQVTIEQDHSILFFNQKLKRKSDADMIQELFQRQQDAITAIKKLKQELREKMLN